ncbi:MAG: hypothetical protein ACRCXT_19990, partial [Paraclostridium sp.]
IVDLFLNKSYIRLLKTINDIELNDKYILNTNKIAKNIKTEITKFKIPCNNIYFTIQNKDILNRNIEIIDTEYEKDINDLVKYELNKFMPIDLDKYEIRHTINEREKGYIKTQVILFPKSTISTCKEISKQLKIKPRKLCVNFNVIQNLIHNNMIDVDGGENLILEVRDSTVVMSFINERNIVGSYTLNKHEDIIKYIKNNFSNIKYVYLYGDSDEVISNKLIGTYEFKTLNLNPQNIYYKGPEPIEKFINNIGLIY